MPMRRRATTERSASPTPCVPRADPSFCRRTRPRRHPPGWRRRSMPCRRARLPRRCAPRPPGSPGSSASPRCRPASPAVPPITRSSARTALRLRSSLRFGLYVQAPESFYPPHSHAAEEFYYVLSGTARWQKGEEAFSLKPPGQLHPPCALAAPCHGDGGGAASGALGLDWRSRYGEL